MSQALQDAAQQGDSIAVIRELKTLASSGPSGPAELLSVLRGIPDSLKPFVMAHVTVKGGADGYTVAFGMPSS